MAVVDLDELVARLAAAREKGGAEATVQADVRTLLLYGGFSLGAADLQDIALEAQAGGGRRIDIEAGFTVIETKRDLRIGKVRPKAIAQLSGYVKQRVEELEQRYVGVLTDGCEWSLYHLDQQGALAEVASLTLTGTADASTLTVWLEGALATTEAITPTPLEIERRLGAASSAHALDAADLASIYAAHRDEPTVRIKRELWAKLLTTAFGSGFRDEDALFVEHTLLVATAEIIAHAVCGFEPAALEPATLLSGASFAEGAGIAGVVESDFFDWIVEVPGGTVFVRALARRLSRFAWDKVEHDVMKVLYESVIGAAQRHDLGEYYTPDWLAQRIVEEVVDDPLNQRVLDPACGSGTFLFWAIRHVLAAAEAAGVDPNVALIAATRNVLGLDVHPLAVAFARVTYLLAIGRERLNAKGRPDLHVPVYLGDSLQWGQQQQTLLNEGALTVATSDGMQLFAGDLSFPDGLLDDAARFDGLVADLADRAANRAVGAPVPSLDATFRRFAIDPSDQPMLTQTFSHLCELNDQGRDHVWAYYVRNLARPAWLARPAERVDRIVGNPPWLAYRYMTETMQKGFRAMSEARGLWHGASVATNQDLSGLFLARCVELYLHDGGRFGLVMPFAALSRRQFHGLRTGDYRSKRPRPSRRRRSRLRRTSRRSRRMLRTSRSRSTRRGIFIASSRRSSPFRRA